MRKHEQRPCLREHVGGHRTAARDVPRPGEAVDQHELVDSEWADQTAQGDEALVSGTNRHQDHGRVAGEPWGLRTVSHM